MLPADFFDREGLRAIRAIRILEGTSEIMRHIVAPDMLRNSPRADMPISVN